MNIFSLSSILVAITTLGISLLLASKGWGKFSNRIFIGVPLCGAIWGLGSFLATTASVEEKIYFWYQIAYIGVELTPVFFFHFIYSFVNKKKAILLYMVYLLGIGFAGCIIFLRKEFFGELVFRYNQFYWFYWPRSKSILYLMFYVSFYWLLLGYSFLLLIKFYKKSSGVIRNQVRYLLLGSIIGWVGAEGVFLPKFIWNVYPYSNFLIAVYPAIFVYAILRYRLMDITVTITRASLFIAVYTLVLGLPFAIAFSFKTWLIDKFGANWWVVPLVLMAGLATLGPFLYIYLQQRAEERLLREQKRYQNTLKQAAIGMSRIRNLTRLLNLITHIVTKTVKISYAAIYIYNRERQEYLLQVSRDKGRISVPRIPEDTVLMERLITTRLPIVYEEIKRQMQDSKDETFEKIEEDMRLLTASVVIPSLLDKKLTAFIVLGDKISGQIYTPDDLNVFQVLASQAALAIENAQFYEEAKEMQAQIAQAEKMATVGTMADGLSHQINNRFYALSLIAGDSIDTIKMTDTSSCSPEVKAMINQINSALERIQVNVMQGGEVVKGILKYTRKGEEGMEPLTLDQILDGTIEMVQYKVKLSEIDIIRDYSKDIPKIKANQVQMQEVFFNFIDNGYDAIVERRNTLKEPDYRGKITVSVKAKDNILEITVQDNGMGVKNDDIKKIFTPFFTTKASSRKGTGLGLYVIRNIVTETHKGKIAFSSEYKVGTRFIIELPIAV
jgi:signal transduction histidine kinase